MSLALKGANPANLQLRHFKLVDPLQVAVAGPSFVGFDPTQRNSYLMFLSSEQGGSYSPVTGQADATVAIARLQGDAF